ncbi:MAG: Uma2 family endonuclease [Acidobacteriota bacterium]|nr:Uma2 family endonuclease [Blastocatellia bacterium]MDW8241110.1 Uma2 family endonuclease [Acidobacteriota bacterium]
MSQPLTEFMPDIRHIITEDDTPVDNFASEKQQRLLTEPLYSSWAGPGQGRSFLVAANVGIFYTPRAAAIVPDVFLSLDVEVAPDWWQKEHRSYFLWEFGKPPEVVIEIVSNREGGEADEKKQKYARIKVGYYVIYDPLQQVMPEPLTIYQLRGHTYVLQAEPRFPDLKLGLTLWEGEYEGRQDVWLRWTDEQGRIILTGKERAEAERERAEAERERAEAERERAEQERQRAEQERAEKEALREQLELERQRVAQLTERLRQLGREPE